ncbi:transcription repressor OFP18-like [Solanum dulcamara]|uniref:transcription repressor OFP18-like n=1 Tax=Solanum dulcamara TaxID=45834 RepID=UPI0024852FD3|nr:transcription repressor OFP18-like [Solanum dulcamara]
MVEKVIEGLKIVKDRFFFEAGGKTSSILEVSSSTLSKSNISTSGNGLKFLPFNDSCVMNPYGEETSSILEMSSLILSKRNNSTSSNGVEFLPFNDSCVMDPYGEETSSILDVMSSPTLSKSNNSTSSNGLEILPFNDSYVMDSMDPYGEETSSILEVSSSTFSKSNNSTSSNGLEVLPFNDSCVIRLSSERDLYESFKGSMVRMIEAKKGKKDWEEYIEEILEWYLVVNEKSIHKYIIGAFCDLWMYYASTSRTYTPISFTNSPFSFSFDVPPSPSFLALVEAKADQIIATTTTTSSVISWGI